MITNKLTPILLGLSLSTLVHADANFPTHFINNIGTMDNASPVDIIYTICSDPIEKNPQQTCSAPKALSIDPGKIATVRLDSPDAVLYVWKAATRGYGGYFENDYTIALLDHEPVVTSNCASSFKKTIVFNTFGTRSILGCSVVVSG